MASKYEIPKAKRLTKTNSSLVVSIAKSQREIIDEDLADRVSIIPDFQLDIQKAREDIFIHLIGDDFENMANLKTELKNFEFDLLENYGESDIQYPEDFVVKVVQEFFNKYKLPPHFYTWTLRWIEHNKKPKKYPIMALHSTIDRPPDYPDSKAGLTVKDKKRLKWLIDFYKKIPRNKEYRKDLKGFSKQISLAKGSVHRRKKVDSFDLKVDLYLNNQLKKNSKNVAIYKLNSDYMLNTDQKKLDREIKRKADRFRKRKSNLKKF
jgi:hypothetical protein